MEKITAPFTDEQVANLEIWQSGYMPVHPFTCPSETCPGQIRALIARKEGFICHCGKYKQDWCHEEMAKTYTAELPGWFGKDLRRQWAKTLEEKLTQGAELWKDIRVLNQIIFAYDNSDAARSAKEASGERPGNEE